MSSISAAGYRSACIKLVQQALLRPQMFYSSLSEFEAMLWGHAIAFEQLGAISRDEGFSLVFAEWLYKTKGATGAAAGWAVLVEEISSSTGVKPDSLFHDLATEFIGVWASAGAP